MSVKKFIPNAITLLNLLSGVIAVFYAVFGQLELAGLFVVIGIGFDFFEWKADGSTKSSKIL